MLYNIKGLCPRREMSGAGFCIQLWPEWKREVTLLGWTQKGIDQVITKLGRTWLDGCGYDQIFDIDNCGFDMDKSKPPGPNARPMYDPRTDIRVTWGEWGPEHITVPGNACGLDICTGFGAPRGGVVLAPHNVDTIKQAHLLLVVFTWFANLIVAQIEDAGREEVKQ